LRIKGIETSQPHTAAVGLAGLPSDVVGVTEASALHLYQPTFLMESAKFGGASGSTVIGRENLVVHSRCTVVSERWVGDSIHITSRARSSSSLNGILTTNRHA
jgi:hypothetical protein